MAEAKTMEELLTQVGDSVKKVALGDTVTGKVLSVKKHEILVDLGSQGVGLVPRKEVSFAKDAEVGQEVTASVIDPEMADGMILLSLRKAVKDKGWDEIKAKLEADIEAAKGNVATLDSKVTSYFILYHSIHMLEKENFHEKNSIVYYCTIRCFTR